MNPDINLDQFWAKTDTDESKYSHDDGEDGSPDPVKAVRPHHIMGHLTDTSEVAGQMWDRWLAPIVKARIDAVCPPEGGLTGRNLVRFLAGIHDIGKISPAFQAKAPALAILLEPGLVADVIDISAQESLGWRHTLAGGRFVFDSFKATGWGQHALWISSVVGGHHGVWKMWGDYSTKNSAESDKCQGDERWDVFRQEALDRMIEFTGVADSGGALFPMSLPNPSAVVLLTAIVITADWVASNGDVMPGIWGEQKVTSGSATERARRAWTTLKMHSGWDTSTLDVVDPFASRFPLITSPRPVQRLAVEMVRQMPSAGLMIVEAPMGEGKTELAMASAEILAGRFGCDGVFFGLPTQATSDAILDRFAPWLASVAPGSPISLAHGKAMINETLLALPKWEPSGVGVDCCDDHEAADVTSVSDWFVASKRRLLSPFVVGTIDNVLLAGAKTKHGCLRLLGLSSKVVILDEVHAADIYMSQFLERALSWLGAAGVPVILMSATLPSAQRESLIRAYVGAGPEYSMSDDVESGSGAFDYPRITVATVGEDGPHVLTRTPESDDRTARQPLMVRVRILDEPQLRAQKPSVANARVGDLLNTKLHHGGCALIIRNTVGRAQSLYDELTKRFPEATVILFHSRFTAGHKDSIAKSVLTQLGDSGKKSVRRPTGGEKFIVVATQVAEQSLDIDADILITDLCPIDLLLQRIGRMWRHRINDLLRPSVFAEPEVWVTRMRSKTGDLEQPSAMSAIYPIALLVRTGHLIQRLDGGVISIPADIPALVHEVYSATTQIAEAELLDENYLAEQEASKIRATNAAIRPANAAGVGISQPSAHGLNAAHSDDENILVREGVMGVEVVLLSRRPNGGYLLHTGDAQPSVLNGNGWVGSGDTNSVAKIIASTVRMPNNALSPAMIELGPLPSWSKNRWLKYSHVLVLDEADSVKVSRQNDKGGMTDYQVHYSAKTGLSHVRIDD